MKAYTTKRGVYLTSDLHLATTLSLFFPVLDLNKSNPKKVEFLFEKTEELEDYVNKYWRRELAVEPLKFSDQLRAIKTRLYAGG